MKKLFSIIFIILCWQSVFSEDLSKGVEETVWNYIRAKYIGQNNNVIIFRKDIAIKIQGSYSQIDSSYMNELVNQLKEIIPERKVYFTTDKANLIFNFGNYHGISQNRKVFGNSIDSISFRMDLSPNLTPESRKKILYYYLYRSLAANSPLISRNMSIKGCVFDEQKPDNITYSPFDSLILGKLYASDFKEQFKKDYIKRNSYRAYLTFMYRDELHLVFNILGVLVGLIVMAFLLLKGAFKTHQRSWYEYNRKGLLLILVGSIFTFLVGLSDLNFKGFQIYMLLSFIVRAFLAVNLIFIAELLLFRKINLGEIRVIFVFLITSIILILVASPDWPHIVYSGKDLNMKVDDWSYFRFSWPKVFSLQILLGLAFLRSLYIFLNDRYKSIINEKDVEIAKINELHKQAELQSLQAKINPHFLYNALNSIASLASTDAKKTEQMALGLSDFFKYSINREQKQFNSLSEELNAIRTYLEIEKVRFGDRLNFEIDCPPELEEVQIPQLLIQPLVENAIKHGLSQITGNGLIRISISKEEKQLKIRIYDNGPAFPEGPLSGYGIQNTQERLNLLYKEKASLNWQNGVDKFIEVCLPLK